MSEADSGGGAAIAATRLHRALREQRVDSRMLVRRKLSDNWTIDRWGRPGAPLATRTVDHLAARLQRESGVLRSVNASRTALSRDPRVQRADVVNVHWVGQGAMSIADIGRLRPPLVMTAHDMWPFCGSEHYTVDDADARWRTGYRRDIDRNRGRDLDRWTWHRKRRHWKPSHLVCPSVWLASCARESALMAGWRVHVIPNPLDVDVFQPVSRSSARSILRLPQDKKLILFGAFGGLADRRKGGDLLLEALHHFSAAQLSQWHGVVFGTGRPKDEPRAGLPLHWLGQLHDDVSLALAYNAADVMVVPSRQEAGGPQTAVEAQACGVPVVAFDVGGLRDSVQHEETGYLASALDARSLTAGIAWVLGDESRRGRLGEAARRRAVQLSASSVVAKRYLEVFDEAVSGP